MAGKPLPYDTAAQIRSRLADVAPHFAALNKTQVSTYKHRHTSYMAFLGWPPMLDIACPPMLDTRIP